MMRIHDLRREQVLDGTPEEVFAFFADAFNLEAITPPLLRFRVVTPAPIAMGAGTFIQYRLRLHGVPLGWDTLDPGVGAAPPLRRRAGPRALRAVAPHARARAGRRRAHAHARHRALRDRASGRSASWPTAALVRRDVEAIFDYRAERVPALLS